MADTTSTYYMVEADREVSDTSSATDVQRFDSRDDAWSRFVNLAVLTIENLSSR
jgi:hypothetical protein